GLLVPAGGSCSVDLAFAPTSIGDRSASLEVGNTSSDGTQLLPLTGTGINPDLSVSPGSLDFGQQAVGTTSATMAVTVASTGTTDLTVTGATASGDFAADDSGCTAKPVPPAQACVIYVTFSPTATGSRTGTLTIKSNALSSPATVSLAGTGVAPLISVTPSSLQFGAVLVTTTSAPQTVTVANAGSSPLTVTSAVTSGPFAVSGDFCTSAGSIAPGGACQIAVVFVPASSGPASGTLTISSDGGTATVALSGSGSPLADLSVSIGASPNPVKRNGTLTYAITVQNAGPTAAPGVLVSDTLPSSVQFQSLSAPSGSSCVTPAVGATGTVKCNLGTLSAGATAQLTIAVQVVAPKAAMITDTVKVTSSATDPDLQDNQATVATTVK
ncbi:MAG TPA: choice-of-anchor D domain-containing protein, partial [Streptosporangiaceae bacterium]